MLWSPSRPSIVRGISQKKGLERWGLYSQMGSTTCALHECLSPDTTDNDLVDMYRAGLESASQILLHRYSPLVRSAARAYARICHSPNRHETVKDTESALYLYMVERLHESVLRYYGRKCRVHRLIGDRKQIVKAFLVQTDQGRHRTSSLNSMTHRTASRYHECKGQS